MTADAAALRSRGAVHVLRMIELHVEAFFEGGGKSFSRWIVAAQIAVTDRAHRRVGRGVLRAMALDAVAVPGPIGLRRVVGSMMTTRARNRSVLCTGVQKFRVIEIVTLWRCDEGKRKKEKGKNKRWNHVSDHLVSSFSVLPFTFLLFPFPIRPRRYDSAAVSCFPRPSGDNKYNCWSS